MIARMRGISILFVFLISCNSKPLYTRDDIGDFATTYKTSTISYQEICERLQHLRFDTIRIKEILIFEILPEDGITGGDTCKNFIMYNINKNIIEMQYTTCQ